VRQILTNVGACIGDVKQGFPDGVHAMAIEVRCMNKDQEKRRLLYEEAIQ